MDILEYKHERIVELAITSGLYLKAPAWLQWVK